MEHKQADKQVESMKRNPSKRKHERFCANEREFLPKRNSWLSYNVKIQTGISLRESGHTMAKTRRNGGLLSRLTSGTNTAFAKTIDMASATTNKVGKLRSVGRARGDLTHDAFRRLDVVRAVPHCVARRGGEGLNEDREKGEQDE